MGALRQRLPKRIRAAAKIRGLALSHVADRAGVVRSHFWRVLVGEASPTLAWVEKVGQALEIDPGDLLSAQAPAFRRKGQPGRARGV